jgi:hypothetical protein
VTRAASFALAARAAALLGGAVWTIAAVYCSAVVLSGFVSWTAPNVYVTAFVVVCGVVVNALLFRRAESFRQPSTMGLMLMSLTLSAIVVGIFAYMALPD